MGLLTVMRRRRRFRVVVRGHPFKLAREFSTLAQARAWADEMAATSHVICVVYPTGQRAPSPVYATDSMRPPHDDGSPGVREPRRPTPGSGSDAIAIDLPD